MAQGGLMSGQSFFGIAAVCAVLGAPSSASAQQPEPPFGQPQPPFGQPQPAPGQPGQPGAGQPGAAPGGFGDQPAAPGGFGDPNQPGAGQPGQPGATGQFGGDASFNPGAGFDANAGAGAAAAGSKDDDWAWRETSLENQNNLSGSTGMLHTTYAQTGAQGTFRVGFMFDWFTSSGFLCDPADTTEAGQKITCSNRDTEDTASHVGGHFSLSASVFDWLEGYASLRTYANSNDQGSPQLLQVLGDTTIGVKGFTPPKLLGPFSVGGDLQLLLLNGTGDVGLTGGATSARIRALSTLDLRKPGGKGFPIRANVNLGYKIDNSGAAVEDVETARQRPISRIERFGLGINRVDFFETAVGFEVPFWFMQPYLEWGVDVPVNRQSYECRTSTVSRGDVCLGLSDFSDPNAGGIGFDAIPSRLSIGTRVSPFKGVWHGLSGHVAFDIGTSGTGTFIEEVAPTAPWTLYIGMGFAFDTKQKKEKAAPPPVAAPPQIIAAPQNLVRGFVHEQGKQEGIPNAIVSFQGAVQPPVATGTDGRFLTRNLEPGAYTFEINAPGFKPATCAATVNPAPAPAAPQPSFPGAGMLPPPQNAPTGPVVVEIDCPVESQPRTGNLLGTVKDNAGGNVAGAVVTVIDALGKEQKLTADGSGGFRLDGLTPGAITLKAEASGFMNSVTQNEIRANEDLKTTLSMNKRPKNPLVKIQGNELKLGDKILFETDSAKILGQSSALLEEIADVIQKNPSIEQLEIQGHTDNTGTREHNQKLSDARANSVKDWLVKAGVSGARLTSKGYGQDRPLAPNVTEANKSKNRRVQFIISKKK